ncbi:MAG: cobalamin biosynthesis protein, partial [Paramuribaculum sp.]|nr:cobalamin biosynthesis protein [Paramuribaculum sp.]
MATPLTLYAFLFFILPLLLGWGADRLWADPTQLPHPVVGFGKMISFCEHRFNHGSHREIAGAITAASLIALVFLATELLLLISVLLPPMFIIVSAILIFY